MTASSPATVPESTPTPQGRLSAHLGLPGATALAITVVVGSGALVLPGIAYRQAGQDAVFAWMVAAAVTVPLLIVFARLGARYPGAGGVAGFVHAGFGRTAAAAVEVLLLGTFALGIPAIALTGGNYVVRALGLSVRPGPAAAVLVIGAGVVVAIGVRLSGRLQTVLALMLTIGLFCAAFLALRNPVTSVTVHVPTDTEHLLIVAATVGTVFFAFTGWEMISFTTEEYRNPRRDFPRVLVLSFVLVTVMYVLLAMGLQAQLPSNHPGLSGAPVGEMVEQAAGNGAAQATTVLGVTAIAANLVGAFWGVSRLVMSSARAGLLPRPLAHVHAKSSSPRRAVAACVATCLVIIGLQTAGLFSLDIMLSLAGRNFYVVYLLSALAYARLFTGRARVFGVIVAVALATLTLGFGLTSWAYLLTLLAVGALAHRQRGRRAAQAGTLT
ncbi:MAG TPA: amino acid permease [Jatrophihabitans sp.]|jgi:amino acid efflux transporter|uniref:APC family permease n=1 Tax=Jatrophihabitans sp. TaxID=1932789 RepID=UPI002F1EB939